MQILSITLLALFGFAAADVSHLAKQYLPPNGASVQDQHMQHMQQAITTTIQKQELQELPEQIEYINPSEATVHSNDNNNAGEMEQQQQMMMAMVMQMPETKYLTPATAQQQQPLRQLQLKDLMPAEFLASSSSSSAQETMPQMQQRIQAMMNYLPPTAMPMQMAEQQPNYQQYQEQLQQEQQPGQDGQQQMEMLEAIRMAIDAVEQQQPQMTQAIMMEPEPAHILAADGYHYKNGDNQRRFRFRH